MEQIDAVLKQQVDEKHTVSVQYAFFDKDKLLHSYRYGLADISQQTDVEEHSTYNAYSVTKTFTALAILQLAEKNKLQLDQPVINYWPEFPYGNEVSVYHLLTHTAGIPNPVPLSWIHLADEHVHFDSEAFFDQVFARHKKLRSKPGEKFFYSNLGYVLLGQLIKKTAGVEYEQYIRDNIISRLGLPENSLDFIIHDALKHTTGYHKKASISNLLLGFFIDKSKYMVKSTGDWKAFKTIYVNGTSYGGLVGTTGAFVKYVQSLLHSNTSLLSEPFKKILFTESRLAGNKQTGMCLSWFTGKLKGEKYYTHAGGGGGYYCEIRMYPGLQAGSVIMFNRSGMRDERFLDNVDSYAIRSLKSSMFMPLHNTSPTDQ